MAHSLPPRRLSRPGGVAALSDRRAAPWPRLRPWPCSAIGIGIGWSSPYLASALMVAAMALLTLLPVASQSPPVYTWDGSQFGPCSAPCGLGLAFSRVLCLQDGAPLAPPQWQANDTAPCLAPGSGAGAP